jgi:hypothetical protein
MEAFRCPRVPVEQRARESVRASRTSSKSRPNDRSTEEQKIWHTDKQCRAIAIDTERVLEPKHDGHHDGNVGRQNDGNGEPATADICQSKLKTRMDERLFHLQSAQRLKHQLRATVSLTQRAAHLAARVHLVESSESVCILRAASRGCSSVACSS